MKKIILILVLCLALALPVMAEDLQILGVTILPNILTAGGSVFADYSSGYQWGNYGVGANKEILGNIYFPELKLEYNYLYFGSYTANSFALFVDCAPYLSAAIAKNCELNGGVFAGLRADTGTLIAGVALDVVKFNLLP